MKVGKISAKILKNSLNRMIKKNNSLLSCMLISELLLLDVFIKNHAPVSCAHIHYHT